MRGFCALMGAITIPVVYATMRESGYPIAISVFSACLILFGESKLMSTLCKEPELTGRQRSCHPDPTDSPRRRSRLIHVALGPLLCQIPPTAIPRVYADMVVLATCDWIHVGLYSRMQDGRTVHVHEYWSCCLVGSLGNSGCQEGAYHGEL
jgi:hypothetical protein